MLNGLCYICHVQLSYLQHKLNAIKKSVQIYNKNAYI